MNKINEYKKDLSKYLKTKWKYLNDNIPFQGEQWQKQACQGIKHLTGADS